MPAFSSKRLLAGKKTRQFENLAYLRKKPQLNSRVGVVRDSVKPMWLKGHLV